MKTINIRSKDLRKKVENVVLPIIGTLTGGALGTLDVLTSEFPIVSGGLFAWVLTAGIWEKKYRKTNLNKAGLKLWGSYVAGSAIPFGINYCNEIYSFVEGILK